MQLICRIMAADRSRLLVIDDDADSLGLYRQILVRAGYEVVTASSGEEALKRLKSDEDLFDLVLTDMRLPGLSGFEVLAAVRESVTRPPAVMISAYGSRESEDAARQLGAAEFVHGPILIDDLTGAVRRNLRRGAPIVADYSAMEVSSPGHAAVRWATLVVPITRLKADVPTVAAWGKEVGKSLSTIKTWCRTAAVHTADSLDFARALRVIMQHEGHFCDWYNHLAIVDSRTLTHFLDRGRLPSLGALPSVRTFLRNQQFITELPLISATMVLLHLPD